jgi:hypothetical protein
MKLIVPVMTSLFAVLAARSASADLSVVHGNSCIPKVGGTTAFSNTQYGIGPTGATALDVVCPLNVAEYGTVYYVGAYVTGKNNGAVGTAMTCTLSSTDAAGANPHSNTGTLSTATGSQNMNIDVYPGYIDETPYLTCHLPQNTRLTNVRIDWEGYW